MQMAGRPKIFDEQAALERAINLFWTQGYESTSTDTLIQAMGIHRGSFYNSFGSKKELFVRAIDSHERQALAALSRLLEESDEPMKMVRSLFLSLADCPEAEHLKGCFAGNTLAELAGSDEELAENARGHLKAMERIFFKAISRAMSKGQLKTNQDAGLLARYLLNLWNGINITRRIYRDRKSLRSLIEWQLGFMG
jgi:TetR/AcrR family transcriptional repressor of nem operon